MARRASAEALPGAASFIGVSMTPGWRLFTRMSSFASSIAAALDIASSAPFVPQ